MRCSEFRDDAHELAVGTMAEPRRSALLDHAARCADCRGVLVETSDVADLLLHAAAGVEPALGFEDRTVARMVPTREPVGPAHPARPVGLSRWRRGAGVAALAAACLATGVLAGRATAPSPRTAVLARPSGERIGEVELSDGRVVLTMDSHARWPGRWICQLRQDAGDWVSVGAWTADDVVGGVWAAGASDSLTARADEMRIVNDSGRVVAVARLR